MPWLSYLQQQGVITPYQRWEISSMIGRPHTHTHIRKFMERMIEEHPRLWVAFLAQRRILEGKR